MGILFKYTPGATRYHNRAFLRSSLIGKGTVVDAICWCTGDCWIWSASGQRVIAILRSVIAIDESHPGPGLKDAQR